MLHHIATVLTEFTFTILDHCEPCEWVLDSAQEGNPPTNRIWHKTMRRGFCVGCGGSNTLFNIHFSPFLALVGYPGFRTQGSPTTNGICDMTYTSNSDKPLSSANWGFFSITEEGTPRSSPSPPKQNKTKNNNKKTTTQLSIPTVDSFYSQRKAKHIFPLSHCSPF